MGVFSLSCFPSHSSGKDGEGNDCMYVQRKKQYEGNRESSSQRKAGVCCCCCFLVRTVPKMMMMRKRNLWIHLCNYNDRFEIDFENNPHHIVCQWNIIQLLTLPVNMRSNGWAQHLNSLESLTTPLISWIHEMNQQAVAFVNDVDYDVAQWDYGVVTDLSPQIRAMSTKPVHPWNEYRGVVTPSLIHYFVLSHVRPGPGKGNVYHECKSWLSLKELFVLQDNGKRSSFRVLGIFNHAKA